MLRPLLSMLLALVATFTVAQTTLRGKVSDEKNLPLGSVTVKVYIAGKSNILTFTRTDDRGAFSLPVSTPVQRLTLKFSRMGYRTETLEVDNRDTLLNVQLHTSDDELREVTVRAPIVRKLGDTISYNVDQLKAKSDRYIEDVIRRIPGISINASGQIKYQGEDINHFYIEGVDMLEGNYMLATQNVRPDDIASVDVYENHQAIKALKDREFSKRAALNLKLKKKSLLRPIGEAKAGIGVGKNPTWLGGLFGLFIASGHQHLLTGKGNNFSENYNGQGGGGYFSPDIPAPTAQYAFADLPFGSSVFPQGRYYHNRSAMGSANNIFKIDKDRQLTVNADYAFNDNHFDQQKRTEYYAAGAAPVLVIEDNAARLRQQSARIRLRWERNADRIFFTNALDLEGIFLRNRFNLSAAEVRQSNLQNRFSAADRLEWTRQGGKRGYLQIISQIGITNIPKNHIEALSTRADTLLLRQAATGLCISTATSSTLSWLLGGNGRAGSLGSTFSLRTLFDNYQSEQHRFHPTTDNDVHGYRLTAGASLFYKVYFLRLRWKVSLPINFYSLRYRNVTDRNTYLLNRPYLSPHLSVLGRLIKDVNMEIGAGITHTIGDMTNFITHPIYTTYRDLVTQGDGTMNFSKRQYVDATIFQRDVYKGRSFKLFGGYSVTNHNRLNGMQVSDGITITEQVANNNKQKMWNCGLALMKNDYGTHLVLKLSGDVMGSSTAFLRNTQTLTSRNLRVRLAASAEKPLFRNAVNLILNAAWGHAAGSIQGLPGSFSALNTFDGGARLLIYPAKNWELRLSGSYNATERRARHFVHAFFLDAGVRWSKGRFDFELNGRNLTNCRQYTIREYILNDVYTYTYFLRPAECLLSIKYKF